MCTIEGSHRRMGTIDGSRSLLLGKIQRRRRRHDRAACMGDAALVAEEVRWESRVLQLLMKGRRRAACMGDVALVAEEVRWKAWLLLLLLLVKGRQRAGEEKRRKQASMCGMGWILPSSVGKAPVWCGRRA